LDGFKTKKNNLSFLVSLSHRYKYYKNICVKLQRSNIASLHKGGPSSGEREKVGEGSPMEIDPVKSKFSKAKKSVREGGTACGFFFNGDSCQ
jgi:hypothetical protein